MSTQHNLAVDKKGITLPFRLVFFTCGNEDTYFYCMETILDIINIKKCIYFDKNNVFDDLKSIFRVKMVDRSLLCRQALCPFIINRQKSVRMNFFLTLSFPFQFE